MFLRIFKFRIDPARRAEIEAIADQVAVIAPNHKGFREITFFLDDETGDCGSISHWDSREDVAAFLAVFGPKFNEMAGDLPLVAPTEELYEIYEPKS